MEGGIAVGMTRPWKKVTEMRWLGLEWGGPGTTVLELVSGSLRRHSRGLLSKECLGIPASSPFPGFVTLCTKSRRERSPT